MNIILGGRTFSPLQFVLKSFQERTESPPSKKKGERVPDMMRHIFLALVLSVLAAFPRLAHADYKSDYDAALQAYQKAADRSQIEAAAAQFGRLAERADAGSMQPNVLYWQGECYYDLKEYLRALACFERALLYPMSNKEEAARFKAALTYSVLGWKETAKWELSRFMRDFPSSTLVPRARSELQKLTAGVN